MVGVLPGLGQSTIVPDVTLVWEAISDKAQFTLLNVLFDGVQRCLQTNLINQTARQTRNL